MRESRNEREHAFKAYSKADIDAAQARMLRSMRRASNGKRKMNRDDWETVVAQLIGVAGLFAWGYFFITLFRSLPHV